MGSNFQCNWISKYFQEGEKKRKEKKNERKKKWKSDPICSTRFSPAQIKKKWWLGFSNSDCDLPKNPL